MSTFKTEAEQVDDLKRWLRSYGPSIIIGVILALVIIYGRQFWQAHQAKKALTASMLYQQLSDAYIHNKTSDIDKITHQLTSHYSSSPYAQYAELMQAKTAVANNDYEQANQALTWVITHSDDKNLQAIARLRQAKVQIADQQPTQAITTLQALNDTPYSGLAKVVEGDALMRLDKPQQAKQAYQTALNSIPNVTDIMPTLQMRIDNIGD